MRRKINGKKMKIHNFFRPNAFTLRRLRVVKGCSKTEFYFDFWNDVPQVP